MSEPHASASAVAQAPLRRLAGRHQAESICPFIDDGHAECGHAFVLGHLKDTMPVCLDRFPTCPQFQRLKRQQLARDLAPLLQPQKLTIGLTGPNEHTRLVVHTADAGNTCASRDAENDCSGGPNSGGRGPDAEARRNAAG